MNGFVVGGDCKHGRRPFICPDCHPEIKEAMKKSIADIKAGRVTPWSQVKKELGIEEVPK